MNRIEKLKGGEFVMLYLLIGKDIITPPLIDNSDREKILFKAKNGREAKKTINELAENLTQYQYQPQKLFRVINKKRKLIKAY